MNSGSHSNSNNEAPINKSRIPCKCVGITPGSGDDITYQIFIPGYGEFSIKHRDITRLSRVQFEIISSEREELLNKKLFPINMSYKGGGRFGYSYGIETIRNYSYFDFSTPEEIEASNKARVKAELLGAAPDLSEDGTIIGYNRDEDVVLTDNSIKLTEDIVASDVTFMGGRALGINYAFRKTSNTPCIVCDRAIIKNKCAFSNLAYMAHNIRIYASIVYLKHSLIDLNTVHEIETIFKHLLNGKYGELPHSNKRKSDMLIIVDFKGAGVDYNKVLELTLQIANNKMENAIFINSNSYTSLIPCMSLCCSMYASTDYQYAELLELAEKCSRQVERNSFSSKEQERNFRSIKGLMERLQGGIRY